MPSGITKAHDRLALDASQHLVDGAFRRFEGRTETFTREHAFRDDTYRAVQTGDEDWIFANLAPRAGTGSELSVIVEPAGPGGGELGDFGWRADVATRAPTPGLIPPAVLAGPNEQLDGLPHTARATFSSYARIGDELWLLAISRVAPPGRRRSGHAGRHAAAAGDGQTSLAGAFEPDRRRLPHHRPERDPLHRARPGRGAPARRPWHDPGPRHPDRARARLAVADHGIGISDGAHDRVFAPFGQIDSSDTRGAGATGLGLSIAKRIIEAHRGLIDQDATPGGGTTFHIELPGVSAPA